MSKKAGSTHKPIIVAVILLISFIIGIVALFYYIDQQNKQEERHRQAATKELESDDFVNIINRDVAVDFLMAYSKKGADAAGQIYIDKINSADKKEEKQHLAMDFERISESREDKDLKILATKKKADVFDSFEIYYRAGNRLAALGDNQSGIEYLKKARDKLSGADDIDDIVSEIDNRIRNLE